MSMMLTVAPAMTAPDGSVTVPRIRPKSPCANSASEKNNTPRIAPSTHIIVLARAVCNLTEFINASFANTRTNKHSLGELAPKVRGSLTPALPNSPDRELPAAFAAFWCLVKKKSVNSNVGIL